MIAIDPRNCCLGSRLTRTFALESGVSVAPRIWVSLALDLLASGATMLDILDDYPRIVEEDILACIADGAEMSRERYVDIPVKQSP
jgi:Protein of unknown function (DUF433)